MSISQVADDYTYPSAKEMEEKGTGLLVTGPVKKEEHFKYFPNSKTNADLGLAHCLKPF